MTAEYLMYKEMEHIFAALTPSNRLVCRVAVHTGLRIGDVLALRTQNLKSQMWVTESKTKKRRRVNFPKPLFEKMIEQAGPIWVFTSPRNDELHRTRQAVWYDIKRAAKAFRLPQNVSVHSLRKYYAVDQLDKSKGNFEKVRKLLNHTDMSTTMLYAMSYQLYIAKYGDK